MTAAPSELILSRSAEKHQQMGDNNMNDTSTIRPPTITAIAEEAVREAFAGCLAKIMRSAGDHYPTSQIGTSIRAFSKAAHERLRWMQGIEDAEEASWRARVDAKAMRQAERAKARADRVALARRAAMHLVVNNTGG
jgi:hypothetical protein